MGIPVENPAANPAAFTALSDALGLKEGAKLDLASQASAEAGVAVTGLMNELRTKQSIDVNAEGAIFTPDVASPSVRTIAEKLNDIPDLRDWDGLDLTGDNDCSALVQAALLASLTEGYELFVPSGLIALGSPVVVSGDARMTGRSCHRQFNGTSPIPPVGSGTWFRRGHDGLMFDCSSLNAGSPTFKSIGVFRDQPVPGPGWSPLDDDYDFSLPCIEATLDDVVSLNTSRFIRSEVGRTVIRNCGGQPLINGVFIPTSVDVARISHYHCYDYWSSNADVLAYTIANRDDFLLGRVDNPHFSDIFSISSRRMFSCYQFAGGGGIAAGSVSRMQVTNYGADFVGQLLYIAPSTIGTDINFQNGYANQGDNATAADIVELDGSYALISLTDFRVTNMKKGLVQAGSYSNYVWLNGKQVADNWNGDSSGAPLLTATSPSRINVTTTPLLGTSGGAPVSTGNGVRVKLGEGAYFGTTDGAGRVLGISHGLPQQPGQIFVREFFTAAAGGCVIDNVTATTFDFYAYTAAGAALPSTAVSVRWEAFANFG